jgi:hypothetical protein
MGMDMYDFASGHQTLYTATVNRFSGHSVFVEEFGPNAWTNTPGPSGEACAIVGLQSCTWNTLNQGLFASLLPFLASQGVTDASLYGTEILAACAPAYPDNGQNTTVLATVTTAMQTHQYSMATSRLSAILSQWNMAGLAGCTLADGASLVP